PGQEVAIYDPVGTVTVVPTTGEDVRVEVELQGRDAERLVVKTGKSHGRPTLRIVAPRGPLVVPGLGEPAQLRMRRNGIFGEQGRPGRREGELRESGEGTLARADLVVSIPAGRQVLLRVGAGKLGITQVDGHLAVWTACADVEAAQLRGSLAVDTIS